MTSEQLFYDKKTGFDRLTDEDKQGIQTYAEGYKKFLDESKTERDAVLEIARMAESKGFRGTEGHRPTRRLRQDLPHQPPQGHHAGCYW